MNTDETKPTAPVHAVVIGSTLGGLTANTEGFTDAMRRASELFSSRRGSRLVWGPCAGCGKLMGVTPSDAIKAVEGRITCYECSPPPLLDKGMVLTDRQLHGCRTTRS